MLRLVVIVFVSLDGVMQGLGRPQEDRFRARRPGGAVLRRGTAASGHQRTSVDDGVRVRPPNLRKDARALAEPTGLQSHGRASQRHPKYVATRTLTQFTWANTEPLNGILSGAIGKLKAGGDENIAVLGSGVLVSALMTRDLVDEYRIFLHPLLIGSGKRLFPKLAKPKSLHLTRCTTTTTGVLLLRYQPAEHARQKGQLP